MMSCKTVASLLLRDEVLNQKWLSRLEVRIHLAMCRFCSRLARQISRIGLAARLASEQDAELDGIENRVLARLSPRTPPPEVDK